jgi:hypothetical protein
MGEGFDIECESLSADDLQMLAEALQGMADEARKPVAPVETPEPVAA